MNYWSNSFYTDYPPSLDFVANSTFYNIKTTKVKSETFSGCGLPNSNLMSILQVSVLSCFVSNGKVCHTKCSVFLLIIKS